MLLGKLQGDANENNNGGAAETDGGNGGDGVERITRQYSGGGEVR